MLSTSRWMGKTQVRGTESCVGGMETNSFLLVALRLAWRPGQKKEAGAAWWPSIPACSYFGMSHGMRVLPGGLGTPGGSGF